MKYKKMLIACVVAIFGIGLIVAGVMVYKDIKEANLEKERLENKVIDNYAVFKEKVELFKTEWTNYHENVANNLFVETVSDEYDGWITILNRYKNAVDEVKNVSEYLSNNCVDHFYEKQDVKNKCDSFVISYETTINYFVKDVIEFNDLINSYNETVEEKVDTFKLDYEYIDVDSDGNFHGRD